MRQYKMFSLACAIALLAIPFGNAGLSASVQTSCAGEGGTFDCDGDGNCRISIDDFDAQVATQLGLNWTVDTQTGTVIVALVDYKELANALFCSTLDDPSTTDINYRSRIVVESEDCVNMFPARVCVFVYVKLEHCGDIYRAVDEDGSIDNPQPIKLQSTNTVDEFPPPSTQIVTYKVAHDVTFVNENDSSDRIVIREGSTIDISSN